MSTPDEDLRSALGKLGFPADHPRFQSSLPTTRDDNAWKDIKTEFGLTALEFGALKNARCGTPSSSPQASKF